MWTGLEFYQAGIRGDGVDIADILAFSVVPISTAIYAGYSYLRHILLLNPSSIKIKIDNGSRTNPKTTTPTTDSYLRQPDPFTAIQKIASKYPKATTWLEKNIMPLLLVPSLIAIFVYIIKSIMTFISSGPPSPNLFPLSVLRR